MNVTPVRVLFAVFSTLLVAACAKPSGPVDSAGEKAVRRQARAAPVSDDTSFLVTTDGIGRVSIGMTRGQFEAATGAKVISTEMGCGENPVEIVDGPDTMLIVLTANDIINAVSVSAVRYATAEGAKIGTTRAELLRIYGERLLSFPYALDSDPPQYGQYAIAAGDGSRSIAFTMKEGRVSFITVIRGAAGFMDLC